MFLPVAAAVLALVLFPVPGHACGDVEDPSFVSLGRRDGVPIAVIDSGVDYNNWVLRNRLWASSDGAPLGWDFVDGDSAPYPCKGIADADHGTTVADVAVRSSAGAALIMPIRAYWNAPNISRYRAGIEFAATHGARIVNISWGAYSGDWGENLTDEQWIVELSAIGALMQGHPEILFVVAAGNDGADLTQRARRSYPADYDYGNVVSVGAVYRSGQVASYSNFGEGAVDLFARTGWPRITEIGMASPPEPADLQRWLAEDKAALGGTSHAAPSVAGRAARIIAGNPGLDGAGVRRELLRLAERRTVRFAQDDGWGEWTEILVLREEQ